MMVFVAPTNQLWRSHQDLGSQNLSSVSPTTGIDRLGGPPEHRLMLYVRVY